MVGFLWTKVFPRSEREDWNNSCQQQLIFYVFLCFTAKEWLEHKAPGASRKSINSWVFVIKAIQCWTVWSPHISCHSTVRIKSRLHTCLCASVHTCADRLLHLDGTDERVGLRSQCAHIISSEGDTQEGCHGYCSPQPPGTKTDSQLEYFTHKHTHTHCVLGLLKT